jgi:hypothetical protein
MGVNIWIEESRTPRKISKGKICGSRPAEKTKREVYIYVK